MATFLDLGLLTHFAVIFPFLLVFVGGYALLQQLKVISEDKGINAIIALALASMTLFSKPALALIFVASPWVVVLFMFVLIFIIIFRFLGVEHDTIQNVMTKDWHTPHWVILILIVVIALGAGSIVFGPDLLDAGSGAGPGGLPQEVTEPSPGQTDNFEQNVVDVVFHPKLLGMLFLLLIALFTIRTLAFGKEEGDKKK
jgi:hypothetical protein